MAQHSIQGEGRDGHPMSSANPLTPAQLSPEIQQRMPRPYDELDFSFDPTFLEVKPSYIHHSSRGGQRQSSGASVIADDAWVGEDGRTYHGYTYGSHYFLPNDGAEQDRLDLQHKALGLLLRDALNLAPVENPVHVLDIATGTGIWAIEFAERNPSSYVVGTDLSPIQPVPRVPNCEFIKEDSAAQEWVYPHYKFDFIHMRAVVSCFNDIKVIFKKSFDNLNSGGWIEVQDSDAYLYSLDGSLRGTAIERCFELVRAGLSKIGRDVEKVYKYDNWVTEAGFVDVVQKTIPFPIGGWPRDQYMARLGSYMSLDFSDFLSSGRRLILLSGIAEDEADALIAQAQNDLANPDIHAVSNFYVVYGRKP